MNRVFASTELHRRFTRTDGLFLAALAVLAALVVQWQAAGKGVLTNQFLDADEGTSMLVADVLVRGGKLYQDITYPYGYLPAGLHAFAASLLGNSIATYLHYFLVLDVASFALLYILVRRVFRSWGAFLFVALVVLPEMIAPGALCGGLLSNAAYPMEPVFMLAIVLLWREPGRQEGRRALLIGLCLGMMQGVKFGTCLVFGASLAAVDLLSWYKTGFDAATGRRLLRHNLVVLGGFLLTEGVWIAVTLAKVPPAIAHDVLWPLYIFKNYASFPVGLRYPHWQDRGYFVGVQLVPCVGAAASLWWLGARVFRRGDPASAPGGPPPAFSPANPGSADGVLILLVFYLLGILFFFKNVWHYYNFAWILALGGAYLLIQPWRIVRWAVLAVWAGNLLLFARANLHGPARSLVPVKLADGEQIWVSRERRAQITSLVDYLRAASVRDGDQARPVVFYPVGGGYHPFFHLPHGGRSSWFMAGFVRPYDDPGVVALARTARWVVRDAKLGDPASSDPGIWDANSTALGNIFDAPTRAEVASRLVCEKFIAPNCWIFSQREPAASLPPPGRETSGPARPSHSPP